MFAKEGSTPGPVLDITPRKPKTFVNTPLTDGTQVLMLCFCRYEVRVIVWDTQNVIMDDVNVITGTDSVDQYIKA